MSTLVQQPPRIRHKVRHLLSSTMLCCGRRKTREVEIQASHEDGFRRAGPSRPRGLAPEMVVQSDFRKVSGISSEVFRQLEVLERGYADLDLVERRGEMVLRPLDPSSLGRVAAEACRRLNRQADGFVSFVEIIKRPGQTLGLYIREGDGLTTSDGVFISRIALESAVYSSGLLKVGDEILAVNLVNVQRMSLDDVVIIMSIPRRLVLTIRSRARGMKPSPAVLERLGGDRRPPVVVVKKVEEDTRHDDWGDVRVDMQPWTRVAERPRNVVVAQPVSRYYGHPTTLEALNEHMFYSEFQNKGMMPPPQQMMGGSEPRRRLPFSTSYNVIQQPVAQRERRRGQWGPGWDDMGGTMRPTGPRRAESEHGIATLGRRGFGGSTMSLASASGSRPPPRYEEVLRRRLHDAGGGSLSDTETEAWRGSGARRRGSLVGGAHSLPRRPPPHLRNLLPPDDDSDGAASAPELPASRPRRGTGARGVWPPSVFTAAEYRAWMKRAPSTSALYETSRGGGRSFRTLGPLPRSARSADSLLDTLRQEELREMYKSPSFARKPAVAPTGMSGATTMPKLGPPVAQAATLPRPHHPQTLDLLKQVPPRGIPDEGERYSGLVWVHLLSGRGLRATGGDQRRDLYCVIECDRIHKARTVIRSGEQSFDWDEIFELDLFDNREVAFLVYSWDPQSRHKLCFKGSLGLEASRGHGDCLALRMEPRGTLYVRLQYRAPMATFQRPPSNNPVGVFGIDLETLVLREESGFAVPLVVKKCVEEVERRGLDIVGIYRLCGSAVRKKTLRDALEKDSAAADLTLEHVPDINVITSVLKDYLRELPEPLFAEGLFDMLADALSVCLQDDPEGNAKLMFSILECLPKVHRCTLLFLMDHLQIVYSHKSRNKMTSQALASVFGPLFACHSRGNNFELRKPVDVLKYLIDIWPAKKPPAPPTKLSLRSRSTDSLSQQPGGPGELKKSVTWMGRPPAPPGVHSAPPC